MGGLCRNWHAATVTRCEQRDTTVKKQAVSQHNDGQFSVEVTGSRRALLKTEAPAKPKSGIFSSLG